MGNELVVVERAIDEAMPTLANILAATPGLPARSFKAGLMSQMQNSKVAQKILDCTLPSILNCAATFSGLGLMPDGVTGQAFILPFKNTATPVIGYKGYNTLGDRAGRTIDGNVVRFGEFFDFAEGTNPFVDHRRIDKATGQPLAAPDARITWIWANATAPNRTPLVAVLTIQDAIAIMEKSPAVKFKAETPYNDMAIGRPAMFTKSAKRRLARGMPLHHGPAGGYVVADALERQFDLTGEPHYLLPGADGQLHITHGRTGEPVKMAPPPQDDAPDPTMPTKLRAQINHGEPPSEFENVGEWKMAILRLIDLNARRLGALQAIRASNAPFFAEASNQGFGTEAMEVSQRLEAAIVAVTPKKT